MAASKLPAILLALVVLQCCYQIAQAHGQMLALALGQQQLKRQRPGAWRNEAGFKAPGTFTKNTGHTLQDESSGLRCEECMSCRGIHSQKAIYNRMVSKKNVRDYRADCAVCQASFFKKKSNSTHVMPMGRHCVKQDEMDKGGGPVYNFSRQGEWKCKDFIHANENYKDQDLTKAHVTVHCFCDQTNCNHPDKFKQSYYEQFPTPEEMEELSIKPPKTYSFAEAIKIKKKLCKKNPRKQGCPKKPGWARGGGGGGRYRPDISHRRHSGFGKVKKRQNRVRRKKGRGKYGRR